MKRVVIAVTTLLSLLWGAEHARGDATWTYAVQASAAVQATPPQITLSWQADEFGAESYTIYRKGIGDTSWGPGTSLPGSSTNYVDTNVQEYNAYEYQIVKAGSLGYAGYGYIYAGIGRLFTEYRGTMVLVVDKTCAESLGPELARLLDDLRGDGWNVVRQDVSRDDEPASVRAGIVSAYQADPGNVKAVFLFGHVPVFRCGNSNPDGHEARPMPADGYYGDMDGTWTNPDTLPSDVELMVGRVDLFNMPGQNAERPWPSEIEMLRNYLNKDHAWRHGMVNVPRRALVGNRFGDRGGEAFAASGFRNFPPFVGWENIYVANEQDNAPADQRWSSMLAGNSWLWAYGCGGGSYVSMSGMGTHGDLADVTSYDIVGQDAKAVFVMMMGSYLGEWDSKDNLMRSVLATPSLGLTCSWAGRPHWYYHHMALGEPIGQSARLTMNNDGLYKNQLNYSPRGVHIALMGDPSLRMHPVVPPQNVSAQRGGNGNTIRWSPSPDKVVGYYVYRASSRDGSYTRITDLMLQDTSFTDASGQPDHHYMVRAVKLEETPSGTYYNPSQGIFATPN